MGHVIRSGASTEAVSLFWGTNNLVPFGLIDDCFFRCFIRCTRVTSTSDCSDAEAGSQDSGFACSAHRLTLILLASLFVLGVFQ